MKTKTIKCYIQERLKNQLHTSLLETGARFISDPKNYLNLSHNRRYDDVSLGKFDISTGKKYLNLEYSEIKYGCDKYGFPACFFVTNEGLIRYRCPKLASHMLDKVDSVLTRADLSKEDQETFLKNK